MASRALVGRYSSDGSWSAVSVHRDGVPEILGARLLRAMELSGGDPASVVAHVFSTRGWTSWPDEPHHPDDPADELLNAESADSDFLWLYLFALDDRRLDIIELVDVLVPRHCVRFDDVGRADLDLGPTTLGSADLQPVQNFWQRTCLEPVASALCDVLDELGVSPGPVGIGTDRAACPVVRELRLRSDRVAYLETPGFGSSELLEFHGADSSVPFPDASAWFEARQAQWLSICEGLGMNLELHETEGVVRFLRVVEDVQDPRVEIDVVSAKDVDESLLLGDALGSLVARPHVVWRWLFSEAWKLSSYPS